MRHMCCLFERNKRIFTAYHEQQKYSGSHQQLRLPHIQPNQIRTKHIATSRLANS